MIYVRGESLEWGVTIWYQSMIDGKPKVMSKSLENQELMH